jgi:DNA (cytosine-5)-methyltransferase 1
MKNETYQSIINSVLLPPEKFKYTALDLFAGCGGLSLGFEAAGFKSTGIEMDADCCDTYNNNLKGECIKETLTLDSHVPEADIVIGGPPCQPFSVRGKQQGLKDSRNGFPVFINTIRKIRPKAWLFENVRGLMYKNRAYLEEVLEELRQLGYIVEPRLLNAAEFGVPQNRERLIVVGHKGKFEFPTQLDHKVTAGEALGDLAVEVPPDSEFITPKMEKYIARYEKASKCIVPRDLHLHLPARTLTCRNLAGFTSDMHRIRLPDGRRRRLTVQEAALLQSFPEWFEFSGSKTSRYYQIGNAVPPLFAYRIAQKIREFLDSGTFYTLPEIKIKQSKQKKLNQEIANAYR